MKNRNGLTGGAPTHILRLDPPKGLVFWALAQGMEDLGSRPSSTKEGFNPHLLLPSKELQPQDHALGRS